MKKKYLLIVMLHLCLPAISFYILFVWIPIYLSNKTLRKNENYVLNNSIPYIINIIIISNIISFIFYIISGLICDKYQITNKFMIFFGICFIIFGLICFPMIDNLDNNNIFEIGLLLSIFSAIYGLYHAPTGA